MKALVATALIAAAFQGYAALSITTAGNTVVQQRLDRLQAAEDAAVK